MTINNCRPEVQAFAVLMEQQLRANDHKGGWADDDAEDLLKRMHEESGEVEDAITAWRNLTFAYPRGATQVEADGWVAKMWDQQRRIGREAADVANFAMMVADVCKGLPEGASNA
jgi:NTP pyrophosphatase (non-canonical NTP hydrolase)